MSLEQSDARIQPKIIGQSPAIVMRTGRDYREPNWRTKQWINDRGRDAINRRRLHDHRSRSAIGRHINALRIDAIRSGSWTVHKGPADKGLSGKSANAACRLRPASGAGSENTHRCHSKNDRHNCQDFQELFHIDPSHKVSFQPRTRCFRIRPCRIRIHQTPIRLESGNLADDPASVPKPTASAPPPTPPNPRLFTHNDYWTRPR
jgi:hypothetical protein